MNGFKEKFTLAQVLAKIGFLDITQKDNDSIGKSYFNLQKQGRELKTQKSVGRGIAIDRNFGVLFKNIKNELTTFVFSFDNKAIIRANTNLINVYLSDKQGLDKNTNKIYRFLAGRTKRYERLINYAPTINNILENNNALDVDKRQRLSLKIDSLKDIDKMSDGEYNRFLNDIVDNLQFNDAFAQFNTQDKRGKVYERKAEEFNNKRRM